MSTLDDIAKLKELFDSGAITQEEYDAEKAKIFAASDAAHAAAAAGPGVAGGPEAGAGQYGQGGYQHGGGTPNYGQPSHVPGTPYRDFAEDLSANKVFGVLSYLSFLCFVSIFAAPKESHYSRFHANQGLVLFIFEIAGAIILNIATAVAGVEAIYTFGIGFGVAAVVLGIIRVIYSLAMLALAIIGIINAVQGNQKPLPVIGGIEILK